jgi:hypothetical protein
VASTNDQPTIHEAETASGPSGAVEYGNQIDRSQAIGRRKQGDDIVVRGSDKAGNRRMAGDIEANVGSQSIPHPPHTFSAGPLALPHFHQRSRSPKGHSFYETDKRKARKKR